MTKYDRADHMRSIHAKRKANTYQKVDGAIKRLIRAKEKINFNNVSNESGVSKATLYNNPNIRERIETLRNQQSQAPKLRENNRVMSENSKDALIESLKRKIKKLEYDNKQLKEQLKVAYADVYKKF